MTEPREVWVVLYVYGYEPGAVRVSSVWSDVASANDAVSNADDWVDGPFVIDAPEDPE